MMFYVILNGQWESMKPDYTAVSLIKLNEKKFNNGFVQL